MATERLALSPHPEGGFFRELHRSADRVRPLGRDVERDALTTIYFLLPAGAHSRWHRVESDEVWHHYEGAPLELLWVDEALDTLRVERLGPVDVVSTPAAAGLKSDAGPPTRPS